MVYLAPARSKYIDKQQQNAKDAAKAREGRAAAMAALPAEHQAVMRPFSASVDAYCAHYTAVANNYDVRKGRSVVAVGGSSNGGPSSSQLLFPRPSAGTTNGANSSTSTSHLLSTTASTSANIISGPVIRPSSANALRYSSDAPYKSGYSVEAEAAAANERQQQYRQQHGYPSNNHYGFSKHLSGAHHSQFTNEASFTGVYNNTTSANASNHTNRSAAKEVLMTTGNTVKQPIPYPPPSACVPASVAVVKGAAAALLASSANGADVTLGDTSAIPHSYNGGGGGYGGASGTPAGIHSLDVTALAEASVGGWSSAAIQQQQGPSSATHRSDATTSAGGLGATVVGFSGGDANDATFVSAMSTGPLHSHKPRWHKHYATISKKEKAALEHHNVSMDSFHRTILGQIKQQVCAEADDTFKHLVRSMGRYGREHVRGGDQQQLQGTMRPTSPTHPPLSPRSPQNNGQGIWGISTPPLPAMSPTIKALMADNRANASTNIFKDEEDHMLSVLVEAITNESMRSSAEQYKTILGYDPHRKRLADFTEFAAHNALLEYLGGQSGDVNGVNAHHISQKSDAERGKLEVLANQVRRGFSHKGLEIGRELPIAIVFPTYDDLAANAIDGKRPLNKKRYDVHSRCMLVGTLLVPKADGKVTTAGGSGSSANNAGALGQLRQPHPYRPASAFDPRVISAANATTVTAEANFKQERRRQMRDRQKLRQNQEKIERGLASGNGERQAEATRLAHKLAAESAATGTRTNEDILQEVIASRRGYRVADSVLDAITEKVRKESEPLRPIRDIRRVKIPDFVEYRDCFVRPSFMVTYEVPNNRLDAPDRSTLDPAAMLTTRASLYDDNYPYDKLEYTMRWGLPIGALRPSTFASDCWVRKVIRMPTNASISTATLDGTIGSAAGSLALGSTMSNVSLEEPIPLGALLQWCGRGAVSIDVQGPDAPTLSTPANQKRSSAGAHYRHSFMFAERGVASVMKEKRYGKQSIRLTEGNGPRVGRQARAASAPQRK